MLGGSVHCICEVVLLTENLTRNLTHFYKDYYTI
nr:MAG TPA: 39S ribosomal protein L2 [Caudoviricetes sp.]